MGLFCFFTIHQKREEPIHSLNNKNHGKINCFKNAGSAVFNDVGTSSSLKLKGDIQLAPIDEPIKLKVVKPLALSMIQRG